MSRNFLWFIVVATLAGCAPSVANNSATASALDFNTSTETMNDSMTAPDPIPLPPDIRELLKNGDGKACGQQSVKDTAIGLVKPKFDSNGFYTARDWAAAEKTVYYEISAVTLASRDTSLQSVECDANLVVTGGSSSRTYPVHYEVRPSMDDDYSFVVRMSSGGAGYFAQSLVQSAISSTVAAREARNRQKYGDTLMNDSMTAPDAGTLPDQ